MPTLVVLPCASLDEDGRGTVLAQGITEDIITALSKTRWLRVVPRSTASALQRVAEDEADIVRKTGADYLVSVRDYRGFDAGQGWRHGVAHGADLLMQLALNPALDRAQLDRILAAVATQVAPAGEHAYTYGEPERLARPVIFVLKRGLHDDVAWSLWLQGVVAPAPMADWSGAFGSQAGLAKRHNTRAFLLALYAGLQEGGDEALRARVPAVVDALRKVP